MPLNIIGVGPGDSELLTIKAVRLINEADYIITPVKKEGSKVSTALSIIKPYLEDMDKVLYYYFPMVHGFSSKPEVVELFKTYGESINKLTDSGKNVVFITLGDPSVYSTFAYVAPYLKNIEYVPGIPSFIHGAALSKIPLCLGDDSFCVLNMTDSESNIRAAFNLHKNIVIMKVCSNQELLKSILLESKRSIILMSNIGHENEDITDDISVLESKMPYFTLGIVH